MSRRTIISNAFHNAAAELRMALDKRRSRRLTPPAPPPPRDSDPQAGEALPSHEALAQSGEREREAALPTAAAAWAWTEGDSDDGTRRP